MLLGRSGTPSPRHQQKMPRGPGFEFGFAFVGAGLFGFGFGFVSFRGWVIWIRIRVRFRNQPEFRPAARNFCIVSEVRFLLPNEPFTVLLVLLVND
jgi:hypothetical protein